MGRMKIISYNVDGLPEKLDLMTLPKWLRFVAYIYKWIKGTTLVSINDGTDKEQAFEGINEYLMKQDADIIVVQEHFNYPLELEGYKRLKDTGKFDLSQIPKNMTLFPPRFKCDGLQIFTKYYIPVDKDIVPWKKSYGYFSHGNDRLTHKGFRYCRLYLANQVYIDIYNVHMDADFYHPVKCPDVSKDVKARRAQIEQLIWYVREHSKDIPTIIIGDFNSYPQYEWDEENIKYLTTALECTEIIPENHKDCDRVFTIGIPNAKCYFDTQITYSDHKPLIVEI